MAQKFWVGGTGTWSNQAVHWAATSGGAPGAGTPTSADDVFMDVNSGAGTLTINTNAVCRSFDATGTTMGLANGGAFNLTVGDASGGALTFDAGMGTVSAINGLVFNSSSTNGGAGWAVTTGGKTMPNTVFGGVGKWVLQDSWTSGTNITHNTGTLDTNGQTVSVAKLASTGAGTRTLTLGASAINLSAVALPLDFTTTTGLTFNANTSTITFTGASATPNMGGKAFNNVVYTGGGSTSVSGAGTYANLTYTGTAAKTDSLTIGGITVSGTLTITGNSLTNRVLWAATGGIAQSCTAAVVSLTNVDVVDRNAFGAAIPYSGTSLGDCGNNNANWVFDTPQTNYWVANGGNYSDAATHWALSSGGTAGTGRVPLPQDTVIFDSNSFSIATQTVALDMPRLGKDFTWNVTNSPTFSVPANIQVFGSVSLTGLRSIAGWVGTFTMGSRSASTFTTNSLGGWSTTVFNSVSGSYTLNSNFITVGSLTISSGGFNANGFNIQAVSFNSNSTTARNLDLGSGTWTLTTATAAWTTSTTTGLTFSGSSATIIMSNVSAGARTFAGGGLSFGTLTVIAGVAGSTSLAITGANTFNTLNIGAGFTLTMPSAVTNIVNALNASGTAGNLTVINASTPGSAATLSKSSGTVSDDYLSIQDSTATGGASWYAGANSTDVSGNSGWIFSAPVPSGGLLLMGIG